MINVINSDIESSEKVRKKLLFRRKLFLYIFGLVTPPYLLFTCIFVITQTKKRMIQTTSSMQFLYQLIFLSLAILLVIVGIAIENFLKIKDPFGFDLAKALIVLALFNGAASLEFAYSFMYSTSLDLTQLLILLPEVFSLIYLIKWSRMTQNTQ